MKPSEVIEKIIQEELEKINNLSQEDKEKVSIENIIYMGKIKGMDLYRMYEKDDRENASIALYKYFRTIYVFNSIYRTEYHLIKETS